MCWLADHHGGEELAPEPGAAAGADGLLNDRHLYGGVLAELVGAGQPSRAGADDNDVSVRVGDHVHHVPAGHLARDDRLLDGFELERPEVVGHRCGCNGEIHRRGFHRAQAGLGGDRDAMERGLVWIENGGFRLGADGGGEGCHSRKLKRRRFLLGFSVRDRSESWSEYLRRNERKYQKK